MDFYSNTRPNLVGPRIKHTVYKIIKKKSNGSTISDKVSNSMSSIYTAYIGNNKLVAVVVIGLLLFFVYRYYKKQQEKKDGSEETKERFSNDEKKIIEEIMNNQTKHLKYDTQATLNPLYSVDSQQEPVNYPPDPLPVNLPNNGIVYTRSLYDYPKNFPAMNTPNYDYDNVYSNPSRSHYTGTYNTYEGAQDTDIINPLGFPTNFNSTTGDFIGQMTNANTQNITDYQSILDNMQGNLTTSLRIGPKYLNVGDPESAMEPPYAVR